MNRTAHGFGRRMIPLALVLLALLLAGCSQQETAKPVAQISAAHSVPVSASATLPLGTRAATSSPSATATVTAPLVVPGGAKLEAQIEAIRRSQDGSRVADFPVGAYKGKNVIIIQVESLNNMLLGKKYEGHEITPNLNKLLKESWYWPNMYSETGMGNTVDAEFIVNSSLYAPKGQATAVKYANHLVPAMPRVLESLGYYTFTMHTNNVMYWNRKQMYQALGFTRYYDRAFYHGADRMGGFGSSDEETFKRAFKLLAGLDASGTPFYSQIITVSAHPPFIGTPEPRRPVKTPKDLAGSLIGKYISAESYSDLAIGKFIAQLKTSKLWDDSIVVFYGDHTAMEDNTLTGKNAAGAKKLLGRLYGPIDRQRVGLIVHLPGQTTPVVHKDVAGQVDIMPTVADMVGADLTDVPHMGRSLFVSSNSLVPLVAYLPGSFLNDRGLFIPGAGGSGGTMRDLSSSRSSSLNSTDRADLKRAQQLTAVSDKWVMSLKKFKGGKKGWIPDAAARLAAKPYGFQQIGSGSQ